MGDKFIKSLVMKWLLDQLSHVDEKVDWIALKLGIHPKVAAAVPGWLLDAPANLVVDEIVDGVREACHDEKDLKALIQDCVDGNWVKAEADLQALLAAVEHPTPAQKAALAALT